MIDIFSDRIYLHGNENHKSGIPCTFPRTVPMQINRSFGFTCTSQTCEFKAQIYMEAMKTLSEEIESLFNRTLASVRDDIHPTDDGQSERSCSGFPKSLKS